LKLKAIPSKIDGQKAMWEKCQNISDPEKPAPPGGNADNDGNGSACFSSDEENSIHDATGGARFSGDEENTSIHDDNGAAPFSSDKENSVHDNNGAACFSSEAFMMTMVVRPR
jgi:hypothetical protein